MHFDDPGDAWYWPAAHLEQDDSPGLEYMPTMHAVQFEVASDVMLEEVPEGQAEQLADPDKSWKYPKVQATHEELIPALWK